MYYKFTFYIDTELKDVDEVIELNDMIVDFLTSKGYEVGFSHGEPIEDDMGEFFHMEECGEA